jgi:hypothetical protein
MGSESLRNGIIFARTDSPREKPRRDFPARGGAAIMLVIRRAPSEREMGTMRARSLGMGAAPKPLGAAEWN